MENTVLERMRRIPPDAINSEDVDAMLMDLKISLVSISVSMLDWIDPHIGEPFGKGYTETGLNDVICITDDDDDPAQHSVAQRLRHVYLRMEAVLAGINRIARHHPHPYIEEMKRIRDSAL
jgi:hypothetical protein